MKEQFEKVRSGLDALADEAVNKGHTTIQDMAAGGGISTHHPRRCRLCVARAAIADIERAKERCSCNCHDQPSAKEEMDLDEHPSCSDCATEIAKENEAMTPRRLWDSPEYVKARVENARAAAFREAANIVAEYETTDVAMANPSVGLLLLNIQKRFRARAKEERRGE